MSTSSYLTVEELKDVLRVTNFAWDDAMQLAIDAASSQIDQECDDQFWITDPADFKTYQASDPRTLWIGSFSSTDDMLVELDLDDDGVFETPLQPTDWQPAPVNRRPDRPYDRIQLLRSGLRFPGARRGHNPYLGYGYGYSTGWGGDCYPHSLRARVKVTAKWGWPTVPWQVKQAAQILAIDHFKSKDMSGNSAGLSPATSSVLNAQSSYNISAAAGMNARAKALLCGLREYVIA